MTWLSNQQFGPQTAIDPEARAVLTWARIQDRPTSITAIRAGVALAAQTVRVEEAPPSTRLTDAGGRVAQLSVTIFGVKDHPDDAVADTDVQAGDRFVVNNREYRVVAVVDYPGQRQAAAGAWE